ncbi:hypothetical protein CWB66_15865 [Pseudoalteromonas sp. S558]|nr:hypothetical protein CWB66_15865 [Pseudoalteromonas sp. S558]
MRLNFLVNTICLLRLFLRYYLSADELRKIVAQAIARQSNTLFLNAFIENLITVAVNAFVVN